MLNVIILNIVMLSVVAPFALIQASLKFAGKGTYGAPSKGLARGLARKH